MSSQSGKSVQFFIPSHDSAVRKERNEGLFRLCCSFFRAVEKALDTNRMYRDGMVFVRHQNVAELVIFLIFADALRLYHSMIVLLSKGHIESAAILNRLLLERSVDALYISKSLRARANRYLTYWQMNRSRFLVRINEQLAFPKQADKARNQQLEEAKQFVRRHSHRFYGEHWSGRKVQQRCAATGLTRQYALSFYEYSSYGHSDPVAALAHVVVHRGGVGSAYRGEKGKEEVLFFMVTTEMVKYMTVLLAILAKTFKMSLRENLIGAIENLRENEDFVLCFRKNRILWGKF